eukprot:1482628-Amphidinium_carterae.2
MKRLETPTILACWEEWSSGRKLGLKSGLLRRVTLEGRVIPSRLCLGDHPLDFRTRVSSQCRPRMQCMRLNGTDRDGLLFITRPADLGRTMSQSWQALGQLPALRLSMWMDNQMTECSPCPTHWTRTLSPQA